MMDDGSSDFLPADSAWIGKPVVMLVVLCELQVPMLCQMIGESAAEVRVRVQPGWVEVPKEMILAVEEVVIAPEGWMN